MNGDSFFNVNVPLAVCYFSLSTMHEPILKARIKKQRTPKRISILLHSFPVVETVSPSAFNPMQMKSSNYEDM